MKKFLTLCSALCLFVQAYSQNLYDLNTIQTIEIVFAQANWDALLDAERAGADGYIEAQSVTINGTVFNSVGVKYKGNSSYNANYTKNPWHIELDTYVDQNYQGYTDIKLSNVIFDPSFVREALSYTILRQYMHAPEANYANVYVNGNLIGLYTNVESISKKFVSNHFGSNDNAFFDCSPPDGAGPQSTNLPNLAYLGTNSASYESAYDMKSDEGWDDLINLTSVLSTTTSANTANIEAVLDVDRALWMLAFDNVMVNIDSYIGQFKQNYYLYKDDNGRFNPIVWDLNMSFGVFGMTGSGAPLNSTTQKRQLSHLLHSTESSWPLVQKLLAVPTYKKRYLAHYKTILAENIASNTYYTTAQAYQALIASSVTADVNKFYSNAQFTSNMTTDVNVGGNTAPGLANLMPGRNSYLSALSDFTNTQPTISNVTTSNTSPAVGSTISITANVVNTNTNAVYLAYRSSTTGVFVKTLMYDDGTHNDGSANDGVYGANITVSSTVVEYYIYAENNNIGAFSPARAEHEFYSINATYATLGVGDVVVNEIMASNSVTAMDQDGQYDDWFELYNNTANTISLDNLYASDSNTNLLKWQFPTGTTIPPNGYLIVWADSDLTQTGLHADFKFSAGGENCILSYDNGIVIDSVTFGTQTTDMSYARNPNGTGPFVVQGPTFGYNNETLSVDEFDFNKSLKSYPNPTSNILTLENSNYTIEDVELYTIQGQLLFKGNYQNQNNVVIDMSAFANGLYLVNVNKNTVLKIIKN
ncbi:MAG: CotH kinase family protein [Gelidibacter sp.]|nr:CotH kinase family protein [Gelidibacter sp.]